MNNDNCKAFLDFFDKLVLNLSSEEIPKEVKDFYEFLQSQSENYIEKPLLTESGLLILEYMQENNKNLKAKDIADGLGINSRKISGAMRKLVSDHFVNKFGQNPVIYSLNEKGLNFDIKEYKNSIKDEETND